MVAVLWMVRGIVDKPRADIYLSFNKKRFIRWLREHGIGPSVKSTRKESIQLKGNDPLHLGDVQLAVRSTRDIMVITL